MATTTTPAFTEDNAHEAGLGDTIVLQHDGDYPVTVIGFAGDARIVWDGYRKFIL